MKYSDDPANDLEPEISCNDDLGNRARKIRIELGSQQLLHVGGRKARAGEDRQKHTGTKPNCNVQKADASKEADHVATLGEPGTGVECRGQELGNPCCISTPPILLATLKVIWLLPAGGFQFSFNSASNVSSTIEFSSTLDDWLPLAILRGDGGLQTFADPIAVGTQRFYRVLLSP
jgi:hypothetical protein